ncbi:MAG: cytochrome c oxidase subunit [Pseudomonadota bacterium]|jgi:cytochrome c oxidase subunit 2
MKHRTSLAGLFLGLIGLLHSNLVLAINDMPGGPARFQLNLQTPATKVAEEVAVLHWMMLAICLVIFVAVFGVMFYSIYKHRKSLGHKSASFHESTTVEIIWTVVPLLIVIGMALPATKTVVAMKDTTNADLTIKVTGYQWKWGYDYIKGEGEGISFLQTLTTPREQINNQAEKSDTYLMEVDNEMVVPVGKKIRMVTTANDVIHSWTIPAFGVKQDAIPGFVRDAWFRAEKVGTYRGQCSELCGKEHAFMPIVVKVVTDTEYTAWAAEKKVQMAALADDPSKTYTMDELKNRGEKVYAANCAACHQPNGKGAGAFPALDGSKVVNGSKDGQYKILLNGLRGMPKWAQLNDVELASVMTYTRNSWGNKTGELIQPKDFTTARAAK